MNIIAFRKPAIRLFCVFTVLCLFFLNSSQVTTVRAQILFNNLQEKIFDNGIWWIEKRADPSVPIVQSEMAIFVNGVNQGTTRQLSFGHKKEGLSSWPEVAVIYNTGYIRLVPFDLPWGTSFILGPAYWKESNPPTYSHNIQISRIDIDTSGAANGTGPIQLTIFARDYLEGYWPNYHFDITYNITIPDPGATFTQMHVREAYHVANAFSLSLTNQSNHQGFKWMQFSSMYIDENFHDSDGVRYQPQSGNVVTSDFKKIRCGKKIFSTPQALLANQPWIEVHHSDNLGWRGNTPNTIVIVNNPSMARPIVPQGYITCSKDPNKDNVGVWLNHESAPHIFNPGDTNDIEYTLLAQDDPLILPPGAATLISPNRNTTNTTPAYTWNKVSDASWYYLWVSKVNTDGSLTTVHSKWYESAIACGASTCSITPLGVPLTGGNYRWWIQTWSDAGYGPWSNKMDFSVGIPVPPGAATLVSPKGSTTDTTPAYTWNKVNASTWYYLWVSRVNMDGSLATIYSRWYASSAVCSSITCSITPAGVTLSSGSYRWWIQTYSDDGGYGAWSTRMDFSLP